MQSNSTATGQLELRQWVFEQLARQPGLQPPETMAAVSLTPLNGDAGFRRYSRLNTQTPLLAVHAPPETEDSRAFVAIARSLREFGVGTPRVYSADFERGFLLLEDFGDQLLSSVLNAGNVDRHYRAAMDTLLHLQSCEVVSLPVGDGGQNYELPGYDRSRLHTEMALLHQWFIPQLLGVELSASERQLLEAVYRQLEDSALQQPQRWVHRDFHSRNLIYRAEQPLGVIDFQDAVVGPLTYDLVSLLRDCYLRWPLSSVLQWLEHYRIRAVKAGFLDTGVEPRQFQRWFDLMGLQRHIKVLGIFARLWLRDGKPGYLRDLPLVLRYTLEVAEAYSEFGAFAGFMRQRLLPVCERQDWYRDLASAGEPP